jgi:ferredoxin-NADP reductase
MRSPLNKVLPKRFAATVHSQEQLNSRYLKVNFLSEELAVTLFEPGQFVNILVDKNTFRSYSICSHPTELPNFSIVASVLHNGTGANYLKNIKIGEKVDLIGPSGKMTLKEPIPPKLYFYSTGSGLCPFLPILHELASINYTGEVRLWQGFRSYSETFATEEIEALKSKINNMNFKIFVSRPERMGPYNEGRITQDIVADIEAHYYLCGNPYMIEEIYNKLMESGVDPLNVIVEEFYSPGNRVSKSL